MSWVSPQGPLTTDKASVLGEKHLAWCHLFESRGRPREQPPEAPPSLGITAWELEGFCQSQRLPSPAQDPCLKLGVLGDFPVAELSLPIAVTVHFTSSKPSFKAMVFPVVMHGCELDHKES